MKYKDKMENIKVDDFFRTCKNAKVLQDILIDKNPMGVVVVNNKGIIKFANPSIDKILGSTNIVGSNILETDTVKSSNLYAGILNAFKGESIESKHEFYVSYKNKTKKYLNVYINPILNNTIDEIEFVIIMINDITEETKLKAQIQSTYLSGFEALASLVDAKDSYTGEHSKNVSKYVSMICENISCNVNTNKDNVKIAATFHDIGKVGIPDYILKKEGKLAQDEYEIMKTHAVIGAEVVGKIDGFDEVSKIIRHHHERWDGSGYPDGLTGDQIPFGSQIISIADTFDAIVSDRVYRKSRGKDIAIQILMEEKGKQFNPELVDAFIKNIDMD